MPPQAVEAERSVLGALMLSEDAWDKVADRVSENDFYRNDHKLIFSAIGRLCERNAPRDGVTVSEELENNGDLQETGGLPYLIDLVEQTPSVSHVVAYADIVRQRSVLRQLISTCTTIADMAYQPEGSDVACLLYTSPSPRDKRQSRMPSSA